MYEKKKSWAEARYIVWEFTLDEFRTLLRIKDIIGRCAYTNKPFGTGKWEASLERIDQNKSYNPHNVTWVARHVNTLKNHYVEQGKSMKGLPADDISFIHRINKIIGDPDNVVKMMEPYMLHYNSLYERLEKEEAIKQSEEKRQQRIEKEEKQKYFSDQKELAKYYVAVVEKFESFGCDIEISIKDLRDRLRVNSCQITRQPFENIADKHIFVKDKTKGLSKDNILIVKKEVQESLDHMTKCGILDYKVVGNNLFKHF
ncbi:HNH endonuclease [Vibrio phage 11895-B1]|uniref:HNH endonuclease n=1 Tax=Vibrio phage 11895-B1 TaxID=754075 RepID=UPI0002C10971|nr:HNH endonuclease [Vibrio phage 11895-B1]AGH32140.1 hypothetical protein VPHG_00073 [Vibrio phage 11895-B1]